MKEVFSLVKKLELYVPDEVYKRLREIEEKYKISMQDLILRTLLKVIEEFERG